MTMMTTTMTTRCSMLPWVARSNATLIRQVRARLADGDRAAA
tara:strand:+ start:459 stop:584 length:126 start_codon:yes stop_codon:yes gene_type:complete